MRFVTPTALGDKRISLISPVRVFANRKSKAVTTCTVRLGHTVRSDNSRIRPEQEWS